MRDVVGRWLPRGSVVLAVTTLGSYILGLLRDRTFFQIFGASAELDAYNAAFLVPDFLFNLLVASGIAAAVVPVFTQLSARRNAEAEAYINSVLVGAVGIMFVVGLAVVLFAPGFSRLVAPGLGAAEQALVTKLMRILALSSVLFAASNTLGAMLVAQRRFLMYGISPILYNLGIIGGSLMLAPRLGIAGVAVGTLVGAGLHLGIRVFDALRSGWRLTWPSAWPREGLRRTVRLMLPKMVGHPVELATFWIFTSLASTLGTGSIAVLNFARNFQSVPVSLIGIAMATAVFPTLAEAALGSVQRFRQIVRRTTGVVLAVSGAAAITFWLVRRPAVGVLLGDGWFDFSDTVTQTALMLGVFCLSIPTESLSHLFARAFYARQNTITPVLFSVVSLIVAGVTASVLTRTMGMAGLPLGFFFGSAVKALGLFWLLTRQ